jgi:hypothetical protein
MGVITLEILPRTGGYTSPEIHALRHLIDFEDHAISEITRATTRTTILVDAHPLPKEMEPGMTQILANTFERNR